ncbi:MAG: circadian clock KaiB family protein [Armatimonadetes bacterium]|nr:circadian clock KaiB family protein [Armatimonadota bacterium]
MQAIANVKRACQKFVTGPYVLEVVDIYQQPTLAKSDQIVATPTLVRIRPAPVRQFIGDMSDLSTLFAGLNLGGKEGETP